MEGKLISSTVSVSFLGNDGKGKSFVVSFWISGTLSKGGASMYTHQDCSMAVIVRLRPLQAMYRNTIMSSEIELLAVPSPVPLAIFLQGLGLKIFAFAVYFP